MIQIFEFTACLLMPHVKDKELKRATVVACIDADGAYFVKSKISQEEKEKGFKDIIFPNSVEFDPIRFKVRNGFFDENCKIYLN